MRIGVVGAGIGGLVSACGLQADGHDVTVFESRDGAGAIGAGLTLFPNSFTALDVLGLGDHVRGISTDAAGAMRSGQRVPSGRWLMSLTPPDVPPIRSLHRSDLHTLLTGMLAPGVLRTGAAAIVDPAGVPTVETEGRTESFDLVLAADGLRSDARRRWGLDPGIRYAGYTAWRGVTESTGHLTGEAGETWGRGTRFGVVPLPDDRVYWFGTLSTDPGGTDDDEVHGRLKRLFGSWHAPIPELIEATPADRVLRHDIYDLSSFPESFVHGRGVLLGDAAHAMTPDLGQGAGQAIEDAATLTLLLRDVADPDQALARYDVLRRPRARTLWRRSRLTGRAGQARGRVAGRLRDTALRMTPLPVVTSAMNRQAVWQPPALS